MRSHERNRRAFTRPSKHEAAGRAGFWGAGLWDSWKSPWGPRKDLPWDWRIVWLEDGGGGRGKGEIPDGLIKSLERGPAVIK